MGWLRGASAQHGVSADGQGESRLVSVNFWYHTAAHAPPGPSSMVGFKKAGKDPAVVVGFTVALYPPRG
jgi:hypothetical protein